MTDLAPEVLPSVWSLIRRSLVESPGISRKELIERLTPRGLIFRQVAGEPVDDSRHVRPSLNTLIDLGVVVDSGADGLTLLVGAEAEVTFRRAITRVVLNVGSVEETEIWRMRSEKQPEHHAEVGLAWLHLQGITEPIANYQAADARLAPQFGANRPLLRDTAPYDSLERLALWCGAAAKVANGNDAGTIPDPTNAILAALDEVIRPGEDLLARDVVDRIGELFAWLPNGAVGRAVAARMNEVPDSAIARGTVPEGVSLALIQLHHEGVLELVPGDDATHRVALSPGGIAVTGGTEASGIARIRRRAA